MNVSPQINYLFLKLIKILFSICLISQFSQPHLVVVASQSTMRISGHNFYFFCCCSCSLLFLLLYSFDATLDAATAVFVYSLQVSFGCWVHTCHCVMQCKVNSESCLEMDNLNGVLVLKSFFLMLDWFTWMLGQAIYNISLFSSSSVILLSHLECGVSEKLGWGRLVNPF